MLNQGPINITSSARVCGLCQFHRQHMLKSGEHPEYIHSCEHPTSKAWQARQRFVSPLMVGIGREIGDTDNTPEWCPVVAEKMGIPRVPASGRAQETVAGESAPAVPLLNDGRPVWLVWSHEHSAWWKPGSNGYTCHIIEAGRYTFGDALEICQGADGGEWTLNEQGTPNEVMVPSPELIAEAKRAKGGA